MEVTITVAETELEGDLVLPESAQTMVVFAHGSGSSRHSPRNQQVAKQLHEAGIATLLFDLLTPDEEDIDRRTGELRFDVGLLAARLEGATRWLQQRRDTSELRTGYFGASTGAAAALAAAADLPDAVGAVVSRGGRPDLASADALAGVAAPTLLIVGGHDAEVLELNRAALDQLRATKRLEVVPGATHLFEEPGALEEVSRLATDWFVRYV